MCLFRSHIWHSCSSSIIIWHNCQFCDNENKLWRKLGQNAAIISCLIRHQAELDCAVLWQKILSVAAQSSNQHEGIGVILQTAGGFIRFWHSASYKSIQKGILQFSTRKEGSCIGVFFNGLFSINLESRRRETINSAISHRKKILKLQVLWISYYCMFGSSLIVEFFIILILLSP